MTSGWSHALSEPHQSHPGIWRWCSLPPRLQYILRPLSTPEKTLTTDGMLQLQTHCPQPQRGPSGSSWQSFYFSLISVLSHPHCGVSRLSLLSSSPRHRTGEAGRHPLVAFWLTVDWLLHLCSPSHPPPHLGGVSSVQSSFDL